jgi:carboxyl-terminal processing protease
MIMSDEGVFSAAMDWSCTILVSSAWKSAALLVLAAVAARFLQRRSAAARHLVWTTALAAILIIPVLSCALPAWTMAVPVAGLSLAGWPASSVATTAPPDAQSPVPPGNAWAMTEGDALDLAILDQTTVPTESKFDGPNPSLVASRGPHQAISLAITRWPWQTWLIAVWLFGAGVMLARLAGGVVCLHRLGSRCKSIEAGPLALQLDSAARQMGVSSRVTLHCDDAQTIPSTWGWRNPRVLLPREAESWPADRLRFVLLHEMAHIARGDYAWQVVGALARAAYWFNPLAWLGYQRMKAELEQASDDLVLTAGADPMAYAAELLHVTSQFPMPRFSPSAALAIGRSARIRRRLESILDDSRNRRVMSRRSIGGMALAGFVLAATAASCEGFRLCAGENAAGTTAFSAALDQDTTSAAGESPQQASDAVTKPAPSKPPTDPLADIRARILGSYVKSLDERSLDEAAIRGMLQSLNDPHSELLPQEQLQEISRSLEGGLTGIGAHLAVEGKQLVVITPLPGSPAHAAGLKAGDAILAVDGKAVEELGPAAAIAAIRGPAGSTVSLRIQRTGDSGVIIKITRGAIRMPSVKGLTLDASGQWRFWLDAPAKIGYVQISEFSKQTADDCRATLNDLVKQGLKGLVVDLRQCPGGMLTSAVETANLFLPEGTIVSARGRTQSESKYFAGKGALVNDVPLLVLIDEQTASAAEILAGALKDNGRATLLGTRTFGKGSIQSLLPVDANRAIRLTTGYFFLPSGRSIDRQPGAELWGVDPSDGFYFPMSKEQLEVWRKRRQNREVLDGAGRTILPTGAAAVATALENDLADPQLAGAYKAMSARLAGGEFARVGQSEEALRKHYARREQLLKMKADTLQQLDRIEKELSGPGTPSK